MALVDWTLDGTVAVVTLNDGENRFNPSFLSAFSETLDRIAAEAGACALVVRSAHAKIFSNGIDLDWLVPHIQRHDLDACKRYFYQLNDLFKRLVTYPLPAIAAINGHAFAGGAILACAFDFRFMQTGRGFFCFPEVDLGIPFLPGMNALLCKAMPRYMVETMQYTGCRLTAEQCAEHHIVRQACAPETLVAEAIAFARGVTKKRSIMAELKRRLNHEVIQAIEVQDVPFIESGQFHIGE
jgi:enoyl-CoA hydratase/carnithine racemase